MTAEDIRKAREFAITAHGGQQYGGVKPYVYHLDKVAQLAARYNGTATDIIICYLHDVLEDTKVSKEELVKHFGTFVANVVDLVSNQSSKEATLKRIRSNPTAVFIKLCDRIANVSEGGKVEKYRREYPLFRKILYKQGEYFSMWERLDSLLL